MWVFPTNSDLIEPVCKIKIGHIFPLSFMIWLFSPIGRELNKICHAICSIFATHFIIQWTCFKQHEFRIRCILSEKLVLQRYHEVGHGLYLHWSWQTLMKIVCKQRYIMIHGIYLHISATWKVRYAAWTKLYTPLLMLMFFCWCFFVVADTDVFCWCWCMYLCWCWAHLCRCMGKLNTSVLMLRQTLIKLVESQLALARRLTNFTVIAIYEF